MDVLRADQLKVAASTLTRAFHDDPLLQLMAADEKKREKIGFWWFSKTVEYAHRWGHLVGNEDASAVAIWFPPGETEVSSLRMLRVGMGALPFRLGLKGMSRFMQALNATDGFHKEIKDPHWYLPVIGVEPQRQGSGLGSALLEVGTSKADTAGVPCYLETATESNLAFYTKRGFEVMGEASVLGFRFWGMLRQPR